MPKFLVGTVAFLGLVIVGLVVALMMADLNQYKPKIQTAIKDASGYEVNIAGDIGVSFSPAGLSVGDIAVAVPGSEPFATLESFDVALELMPLLSKEVKVKYLNLDGLHVKLEKNKNGKFNYQVKAADSKDLGSETTEGKSTEKAQIPLVEVSKVNINDVFIEYLDKATEQEAKVNDLDIALNDIVFDSTKEGLAALGLKADTNIAEFLYGKYRLSDISMAVSLENKVVDVTKMDYTIFGSNAKGDANIDLNPKLPKVTFSEHIPKLKLENFSKEILEKDVLEGLLDAKVVMNFSLGDKKQIFQTLDGDVVFDGKNIGLKGYDIDKILTGFDDTQSIGFTDVGSFLVAGPLGFLLSNSVEGAKAYEGMKGGSTAIKHAHVNIDIAKQIAVLKDIALATNKNRMAVKGKANISTEKFLGVSFGVLDEKGCTKYEQTIQGSFSKPKIKVDEATVNTVVNMASSLLGKVSDMGAVKKKQEDCKVFYSGVVEHP